MAGFASSPDEGGQARGALARLDRLAGAAAGAAAALGAGVVLLMVAIVGYAVVKRYILGTPVTWTDELSGYLVVALVMFGAAEALRRGDHISVDLMSGRLSGWRRRLSEAWANASVLVVSVCLLVSSKSMIAYSAGFDIVSEGYMEVPMWIPQSALVAGCGLLSLVSALNLVRMWRGGAKQ